MVNRWSFIVLLTLFVTLIPPAHATAVPQLPQSVPVTANQSSAPLAPSADALERPSIIYHNQRTGYSYTHADIAHNDAKHMVSMVYSRQEGTRYKVYYQQRPYLDYDLHPAPELLIADHPLADLSSNAYQYPRINADDQGNVHLIWVVKDTLYYRMCSSGQGDCTSSSAWSTTITWLTPIRNCPIWHPSIISWHTNDGSLRIGISLFVGGSSDKVFVLWKSTNNLGFGSQEVVYSPMKSATPALTAYGDDIKVIYRTPWTERSLAYKEFSLLTDQLSPEQVLAQDTDPVLAPEDLLTEDGRALFISTYAIQASPDHVFIGYPNTSNHIIFMTCSTSCLQGTIKSDDLTTSLTSTALHDVRIALTSDQQPVLIWKDPTNHIKVAHSFAGRWGSAQTFHTTSNYVANVAGSIGISGVLHIGWTEMNPQFTASTDHYGQSLPEPVIFIPGTLGSTLYDVESQETPYPPIYDGTISRLSMNPNVTDRYRSIIGGHILSYYAGNFVDRLKHNGYTEYKVEDINERRTATGCDISQRQDIPNFFPFAYDWRNDISKTIDNLDHYIQCVKRFYPSMKVNLIGHSQGTLIGRKYLLFYGTQNIRAFMPIGGPWWGAPGAIAAFYGDYLGFAISKNIEDIEKSFPSISQQSPSKMFFDKGYRPLHEEGYDFDGDGISRGALDYNQYAVGLIHHYQPNFAVWNESIHNVEGQDNWNSSLENVEYHNIYTKNNRKVTVQNHIFYTNIRCTSTTPMTCWQVLEVKVLSDTKGDTTVPQSILEGGSPRGSNAETLALETNNYEHSEQISMPEIQNCVLLVLSYGWCTNRTQPQGLRAQASLTTTTPVTDVRFINLRGMQDIRLTDTQGLTIEANLQTGRTRATSDLQLDTIGDSSAMLAISSKTTATLTLRQFPRSYFALESIKGQSNTVGNELIRFQDVTLPTSAIIQLTIGINGIAQLKVDENNDGIFERTIQPSVSVRNPNGVDIDPPTINFTRTILDANRVTIAMNATDPSGVQRLMYSLDGTVFRPYTATLTLDARQVAMVYAFAEDTLTNRSASYQQPTALLALGTPRTIPEQSTTIPLSVNLDLPVSKPVTVEYAIERGNATPFEDYVPITGTLQFAPFQTQRTINLSLLDDGIAEPNETLTMTLRYPHNAGFQTRQQTITIIDNESPPTIQFKQPSFDSREETGVATTTLMLNRPSGISLVVTYHTVDGTATASNDFVGGSKQVTIPEYSTQVPLTIPLTSTLNWEETEQFQVVIDRVTHATIGSQNATTVRILNNKVRTVSRYSFEEESVGSVPMTIQLSSPQPITTTVDYHTVGGDSTSTGWALANQDFIPITGTVTFAPFETTKTITISVVDDTIPEQSEFVGLDLVASQHLRISYYSPHGFWISPNDHIGLRFTQVSGYEGADARVWVSLDATGHSPTSVHYRTINGTAVVGQDYIAQTGVITVTPMQVMSNYISIPIIDDSDIEADETFTLEIYDPINGGLGTITQTLITIPANDVPIPTATPLPANSVLFVTGSPASTSDTAVINRLTNQLGLNVITKDHNSVTAADASNGIRLVLISSSVSSTNIGSMFRDTAVPVIVWENAIFDDMNMTGTSSGTNFGTTTAGTQLTITNSSHPLAAGLSGTVNVHTSAQQLTYAGGLPASAIDIAYAGATSKRVIWGYESGSTMVGLTAPARRVGFFFGDASGNNATSQAWQLFDAAVTWAMATPSVSTPTATSVPTIPTATTLPPTSTSIPPTATNTTIPPTATPSTGIVLFVAGATTLNPSDTIIKGLLEQRGYTVIVKKDSDTITADAAGKLLIVISSTVTSGNVNSKFLNSTVPVVTWEMAIFDDMKMTGNVVGTDQGTTENVTTGTIVNASHPLAAGLSGSVTLTTSGQPLSFGEPTANGVVIVRAGGANRSVLFGYEACAVMKEAVVAPARRVGLFLNDTTAAVLTPQGTSLINAALTWAVDSRPCINGATATVGGATATSILPTSTPTATSLPPTATHTTIPPTATNTSIPPTVTNTATPSGAKTALFIVNNAASLNAGDTAVKTRLEGLGYSVTLKTASTSVSSDATGKTLVLISSSVTSTDVNTKFKSVTIPVIIWEYALYDDMAMTNTTSGTDYGYNSGTSMVITNASHPLAAGLSGTISLYSASTNIPFGIPSANAMSVGAVSNTSTRKLEFAYDKNAPMIDGFTVNARRVGLFFMDTGTPTSDGWILFDAAITWATAP